MKFKWIGALLFAQLLTVALPSMAAIQKQLFSITGSSGEVGTGNFTWDDATVPNGTILNNSSVGISHNVLSLNISITDPVGIVGSTDFTLSDCTGAILELTPDFASNINFFDCDNGTYSLDGVDPYQAVLAPRFSPSPDPSNITFTPGPTTEAAPPASPQTTNSVPTMSAYGLVLTMLGLLLVANRRLIQPMNSSAANSP